MQDPVLVLNTNFEPLNVCTIRRAMGLLIDGRASLVLDGRGTIHSIKASFPKPSIIRLEMMVKRPRLRVRLTKHEILLRDDFTCQYCGMRYPHLTIDHIIPRRLGGSHTWENLVAACPSCNYKKGGRTAEQAKMHLLRTPKEPPASSLYLFSRHLKENQDWLPFIQGW